MLAGYFEIAVNPRAGSVALPNGLVVRSGETVLLTPAQMSELREDTYTGSYRGTGSPLLKVVRVPQEYEMELRPYEDGPLDFAYPVKVDKTNQYPELRYSLRSIQNMKGAGRVYIAGGVPPWINERVTAISVPQVDGKYAHAGRCLEALLDSDISDPFVWMNDDMVFLSPTDDIPAYARQVTVEKFCSALGLMGGNSKTARDHNEFVRAMRSQRKIIKSWGFDPEVEYAGDTHHPLLVDKARLKDIIARIKREFPNHPIAAWKMIYNAGRDPIPVKDSKLMKRLSPLPTEGFVSFDDRSWEGLAGKRLRLMLKDKGPFEK